MFYAGNTTMTESYDVDLSTAGLYKYMYECEQEWGKIQTALSINEILTEAGYVYGGVSAILEDGETQQQTQPAAPADGAAQPTGDQQQQTSGDQQQNDTEQNPKENKPNVFIRLLNAIRNFFRKLFKRTKQVAAKAQASQTIMLKSMDKFWAQYGKDILALGNGKTVHGYDLNSRGPFNGYSFSNMESSIRAMDEAVQKIVKSDLVVGVHKIKNRDSRYTEERYNQEKATITNNILNAAGAKGGDASNLTQTLQNALAGEKRDQDSTVVANMILRINPQAENSFQANQKRVEEYTTKFSNYFNKLDSNITEYIKAAEGGQLNAQEEGHNRRAQLIGECGKMINTIQNVYINAARIRLKQAYRWANQAIGKGTGEEDENGNDANSNSAAPANDQQQQQPAQATA